MLKFHNFWLSNFNRILHIYYLNNFIALKEILYKERFIFSNCLAHIVWMEENEISKSFGTKRKSFKSRNETSYLLSTEDLILVFSSWHAAIIIHTQLYIFNFPNSLINSGGFRRRGRFFFFIHLPQAFPVIFIFSLALRQCDSISVEI